MAQSKSTKKSTTKKSKTRGPVRDIKPKKATEAFTIHHLEKEEAPAVEPLIEISSVVEPDFETEQIETEEELAEPEMEVTSVPLAPSMHEDTSFDDLRAVDEPLPKDIIKVRFDKFVHLVSNHELGDIVQENAEEEIILSTNLLTELAGSRDNREERKIPLVFIVGIAIGIVLTYIFFST